MSSLARYRHPVAAAQHPPVELAAEPLNVRERRDRDYAATTAANSASTSEQSWANYRRIGELRYGISRLARVAGYAHLFACRRNARGEIIEIAESGSPYLATRQLYGRFGGTRGLIERFYTLMSVVGDSFLVRTRAGSQADAAPDGVWFLSPSEIDRNSIVPGSNLTAPVMWSTMKRSPASANGSSNVSTRQIPPGDFLGRVWHPDPEYVDDATSPMESINYLCDLLWTLTESIKSRLMSRFAMAGIVLVPNEMNDAAIHGVTNVTQFTSNKVLNYLIHVMSHNMVHHGSALGSMPIAISGPSDALEKFRHVISDVSIAETDLKLRVELLDRIFDAFDTPKANVTGDGQSHWQAWASADDERRIAVQPALDGMCNALTRLVYWPDLAERQPGWSEDKIREWTVWYDLSGASVKTNKAEDTRLAFDRFAAGPKALRRESGLSDLDAPTEQEWVRMYGAKHGDPYLAFYGLEGIEIDYDKVGLGKGKTGPTPQGEGEGGAGPGVGDPGSPNPSDRDSDTPRSDTPE